MSKQRATEIWQVSVMVSISKSSLAAQNPSPQAVEAEGVVFFNGNTTDK